MSSEYAGRRVVVAGLGISGVAAAQALLERGARVLAVDDRSVDQLGEVADRLRVAGAELRLGDSRSPVDADIVVTSPGWRPDQPLLVAAQRDGVEVIGEPELAWQLRPADAAPWVAVTGTNGKTTTVGMIEAILRAAGYRSVAAGNVGRSLLDAVLHHPPYDVIAVELSSFQLHWSRELAPEVAVVTNLAADHLDWHGSMAQYVAAKAAIYRYGGCQPYNADDPLVSDIAERAVEEPHPFTLGPPVMGGFGLRDGALVDFMSGVTPDEPEPQYAAGGGIRLLDLADFPLPGSHNVANALAAAASTRVFGLRHRLPWPAVGQGLRAFRPERHRGETVAAADGIAWVDDSKATNPHAAAASLGAYPSVVWIAGGLLKGADVDPLVREHAGRLRGVILLGRDQQQIADAVARHAPDVPVSAVAATDTDAMDEAVAAAAQLARPGDTVLLAPAAASWDMFRDYAERGDRFAAAASRLAARS